MNLVFLVLFLLSPWHKLFDDLLTLEEHKGKVAVGREINNVKFKKMVIPGDMLKINAKLLSFRRGIAKGSVEGSVDGGLVCKADFTVCLRMFYLI